MEKSEAIVAHRQMITGIVNLSNSIEARKRGLVEAARKTKGQQSPGNNSNYSVADAD